MKHYSIIIIGAGAAGIGFGAALQRLDMTDFMIIEKGQIGDSFLKWPKTTHFITPSFTSNGFGFPDLNAVVPDTSPAFTFEKEHLSGPEYAHYLQLIAAHYQLPIESQTLVESIEHSENTYYLQTSKGRFACKYLIMATGEFQNPNTQQIKGAEFGIHYGQVDSFHLKSDDPFLIIGGNESACDALTHLASRGNQVHLYTPELGEKAGNPDPSISLSPQTKERLKYCQEMKPLSAHIHENKRALEISKIGENYQVRFSDDSVTYSKHRPILATGFLNTSHLIKGHSLFDYDKQGLPIVTKNDESSKETNCFLIGPSLRQENVIFCYIYKFRQRFLPLIVEIAKREGITLDSDQIEFYKNNQMFLDNLNCCTVTCDC